MAVDKFVEELERKLQAEIPDLPDMSLSSEQMAQVRQGIRQQLVIQYQQLITSARLNRKVGDEQVATQQEASARKIVLMVVELDRELG